MFFVCQKLQFTEVQATREAFTPQLNIQYWKMCNLLGNFFLCLWVIFALLDPDPDCESGFGYGSRDPIESGSNPDLDTDPDSQH